MRIADAERYLRLRTFVRNRRFSHPERADEHRRFKMIGQCQHCAAASSANVLSAQSHGLYYKVNDHACSGRRISWGHTLLFREA